MTLPSLPRSLVEAMTANDAKQLESLSEAHWQRRVTDTASLHLWRWYHPPANAPHRDQAGRAGRQQVNPGFPDLMLVRGPWLLAWELKSAKGKATEHQLAWLGDLAEVPGICVGLLRPKDWPMVYDVLSGHTEPPRRHGF